MKPNLDRSQNFDLDRNIIKLLQILTHINLDNFQYRIIQGTTDPVPDTQRLFRHGMNPRPYVVHYQMQDGGCYTKEINNTDVDIRSTKAGSNFTAIVLG